MKIIVDDPVSNTIAAKIIKNEKEKEKLVILEDTRARTKRVVTDNSYCLSKAEQ